MESVNSWYEKFSLKILILLILLGLFMVICESIPDGLMKWLLNLDKIMSVKWLVLFSLLLTLVDCLFQHPRSQQPLYESSRFRASWWQKNPNPSFLLTSLHIKQKFDPFRCKRVSGKLKHTFVLNVGSKVSHQKKKKKT